MNREFFEIVDKAFTIDYADKLPDGTHARYLNSNNISNEDLIKLSFYIQSEMVNRSHPEELLDLTIKSKLTYEEWLQLGKTFKL